MELTSRLLVVLCLLTIYIARIATRSVLQDSLDLLLDDSLQNDEENSVSTSVNSYRHLLEHSSNIQALRWSLRKLDKDELCEFCDIIVPVVSSFLIENFLVYIYSTLDSNTG